MNEDKLRPMNYIAAIEMSVLKVLNKCFEHGQAHYTWKIAEDAGLPTDYAGCALISLRNRFGPSICAASLTTRA